MTKLYTFDATFQQKVVAMMLRDEPFASRIEGLIDPAYFDDEALGWLARTCNDHWQKYRQVPSGPIVFNEVKAQKAAKRITPEFVDDLKPHLAYIYDKPDLSNRDYTVKAVSAFARERAIEDGLVKAADLVEHGADVADIRNVLTKAMDVGSNDARVATDLIDDLKARIDRRTAAISTSSLVLKGGITTGHRELDALLYWNGWGRKELYSLMGGPKSGKSIGLVHFALKAWEAGYNVAIFTLENSAEITMNRADANVSGVPMKKLDENPAKIKAAYDAISAKAGILKIEEFPMLTTKVSDLRRALKRYQSQSILFDLIVVDYADIMAPEQRHSEKRHASEEVYANLRNLAREENAAVLTATQTNRAGAKAAIATKTDVAEDINKTRLVDGLISINADKDEKARGEMRLWIAASRNSEDECGIAVKSDRSCMRFITKFLGPTI